MLVPVTGAVFRLTIEFLGIWLIAAAMLT